MDEEPTTTEEQGLPAIDALCADALYSAPIQFDWSAHQYDGDGYGEDGTWTFWEVADCYECEQETDAQGYCNTMECPNFAEHNESCEGPMMNYYYPLGSYMDRHLDPEEAAVQLHRHGSTTCLVRINGETHGLALTGGGMDLSWEICQSFIALGLLPPLHFAKLPAMAGRPRGAVDEHIVLACLKSFEVADRWHARGREHLQQMLAEKPE